MADVPIIDLERTTDARRDAIDAACREWGFFQVMGHGIDPRLAGELSGEMRDFFDAPRAVKEAVERSATNVWGYYDRELTKNRRDWKEIFDVGPTESAGPLAGSEPQWPEHRAAFRSVLEAWSRACEDVALRLVEDLERALGVYAGRLKAAFSPTHTSFLRLNHYPLCPDPALADAPFEPPRGQLGISHHTDAGALTLLLQDGEPGLQVYRGERWHLVPPIEDALVINIGDIAQVWSNDRYHAPLHRVLASDLHSRHSAAYFFNPSYATDYAPCAPITDPPRYRAINWGRFVRGVPLATTPTRAGRSRSTSSASTERQCVQPDQGCQRRRLWLRRISISAARSLGVTAGVSSLPFCLLSSFRDPRNLAGTIGMGQITAMPSPPQHTAEAL